MTLEERAVNLCPDYDGHAHGNVDALGKCCERCLPIADAIRAAVTEEREVCATIGDCWAVVYDGDREIVGRQIAAAIRARGTP